MNVLVGAPAWKREWIIPEWVAHVERAAAVAGVDVEYLLVLDLRETATELLMRKLCKERYFSITWVEEGESVSDGRQWDENRYRHMVNLRNELLSKVRRLQPDLFLSLDTDILIHEQALQSALDGLERFDAVGLKCYLSESGCWAPNYAATVLDGLSLLRPDSQDLVPAEVVMAAKLMTPSAYAVDYEFHAQGEDTGWSVACRRSGLRLGWDGRVCSKHVMSRQALHQIDKRCGY